MRIPRKEALQKDQHAWNSNISQIGSHIVGEPADVMCITFLLIGQSLKMRLDLKLDDVWWCVGQIQLFGLWIHRL